MRGLESVETPVSHVRIGDGRRHPPASGLDTNMGTSHVLAHASLESMACGHQIRYDLAQLDLSISGHEPTYETFMEYSRAQGAP